MSTKRFRQTIVATGVLFLCAGFVSAGRYTLSVAGERLEYVPQAERGYVVKLAGTAGGIQALGGISALDGQDSKEVRGLGRRGIWTVENNGPASRNENTIRSLRASSQVAYAAPLFSSNGETVAIIPEIVVRVKPGTDSAQVEALCRQAGCRIKKQMEFTEQEYLLDVLGPDADAVFAAVERLSQASQIEWACPNIACRPQLPTPVTPESPSAAGQPLITAVGEAPPRSGVFPNDEYFPRQWHLHNTGQSGGTPGADIRAPEAWEITTGDPNIVVALIDCGIDTEHPDLMNNLVAGYDFVEADELPDAERGGSGQPHGTACAGLVAAQGNNGIGVTGVTWQCKVMPIRIARGTTFVSMADLASSFRWAAAHGADIFSDSSTYYSSAQPTVQSAITDVTTVGGLGRQGRGCAFFTATANSSGPMEYPEKYPQVIAVSPTDHRDLRCTYSSSGPELDIVAPSAPSLKGADKLNAMGRGWIWTTDLTGSTGLSASSFNPYPDVLDYALFTGSSAACPIAAAVAALILSIEPNLTSNEVRHFLERSAKDLGDPGRDDYYGWGRVDARAALDMVLAKRCDLNNDWQVDEQDLALLNAAIDANDLSADIAPAKRRDGVVDAKDLDLLTQYLGTVLPELGLVGRWKFDEIEGMVAHDSEGKNNATVIGGALWQPEGGQIGGALQLTGTANFLTAKLARNPSEGPTSIFAWVKGGKPGQVILSQAGGANWLMADDASGAAATNLSTGARGGKALASQAIITDGNWHRVGLVWDGANRILYVDDVEVARDTQPSLAGSAANLTIGAGSTFAAGTYWSGLIDDLRIYDRAVKP